MPVSPAPLVRLDDIRAAAVRIASLARRTPLLPASVDPRRAGLWLKCENLQVAGSFKIRGAANMLRQLERSQLDSGVITYSSGNHGQAVACAARLLGAPAVVVMPTTAPRVKVEAVRGYGAEVVFAGTTSLDRKHEAERLMRERALTMVPPFDHPWIIAGQGTLGLELLDQCPDAAEIYVPMGGGGLIAGVAASIKRLNPAVRIVGVEPAAAAKMSRSLAAGAPVTLEGADSIADGLKTVRPGELTFGHVRALVDEVVTVSEEGLLDAVAFLVCESRVVAEPSGAATVAAIRDRFGAEARVPHPVVAVVSGGNVAPERLCDALIRNSERGIRNAE
jgi:threonine dehydratase